MPLSITEEKLRHAISTRAEALVDDLRLHVALPTGLNNAPAIDESRERFTSRLRALNAAVEIVPPAPSPGWLRSNDNDQLDAPPTAICRRRLPNRASVLLAGHLDTVHDPRSDFRTLNIAPDGRTATGPGCVDMKGGLVIAVAALEALEEIGLGDQVSWSFLLNADEETGSYHSGHAIHAEAATGWYAAGIALEPATTDGGLVVERGGSGQFMIEARGRAAHVGRDFFSGASAVYALADRITRIERFSDKSRGLVANIGPLQGGATTNTVPDLARAWGNVRFRDETGATELRRQLDALANPDEPLPAITVSHSFNRPAKPLIPATQRLADLARTAAEDLGQRLPFGATGGVCDGNNMQAAGLPSIDTLGVRGGGLHTPHEWIEIASLVERCQLLALTIYRLSRSSSLTGRGNVPAQPGMR